MPPLLLARRLVRSLTVIGAFAALNYTLAAQDRLIDQDPFDRIILDEANGNRELDVAPLGLNERQVPDPLPRSGTLRVRLMDRPLEEFDIRWANITGIRLFESMVLEEARRLAGEVRFRTAHEYLTYLRRERPNLPGLQQATDDILEAEATWAFQQGEHERAWMVLSALYDRNPERRGIARAFNNIADRLLQTHVSEEQFRAARRFVDLLAHRFGPEGGSVATRWREKLHGMAAEQLGAAQAEFDAGNLDEARRLAHAALAIEPSLADARALAREIAVARPRLVVAVTAKAPAKLMQRLDDWASRRVEPLIDPPLVELRGFGAEGGEYRSAYGELLQEAGGMITSLVFTPSASHEASRAYAISRQLLATTASGVAGQHVPAYRRDAFVNRLANIAVEGTRTLKLTWKRSHVRPEALLRVGFSEMGLRNDELTGPFGVEGRTDNELTFVRQDEARPSPTAPIEIVEQFFESEGDAVDALLRDDVDMVERISASDVRRLQGQDGIVVEQYALPTVHVLVVSASNPLLQAPDLRRALVYGLDRQSIVRQLLHGDGPSASATVISGPFPPGGGFADPIGYAYNRALAPHPYDPRLAATLATVAARLAKTPGGGSGGNLPELTLGFPDQPLPRAVCHLMAEQLGAIGIPIRLEGFQPDELDAADSNFDLRYAELAMWEPVVDAQRLLGPRGELGRCSARMGLALADLDRAQTWQDVRERLGEIHRIARDELDVIPLWQTVNYFAYRDSILGVTDRPVSLYQGIEDWDLSGGWEAAP